MVLILLVSFVDLTGPGHSLFEANFASGFWHFLLFAFLSVVLAWSFEAFPETGALGSAFSRSRTRPSGASSGVQSGYGSPVEDPGHIPGTEDKLRAQFEPRWNGKEGKIPELSDDAFLAKMASRGEPLGRRSRRDKWKEQRRIKRYTSEDANTESDDDDEREEHDDGVYQWGRRKALVIGTATSPRRWRGASRRRGSMASAESWVSRPS
jgi:hypothetical protein